MPTTIPKRLIADDAEGLEIISAALQDSLCKPADLNWQARQRRLTIEINRFHWESAGRRGPYFRSRSVVSIESVLGVRAKDLPRHGDDVLQILAVHFVPGDEPAGKMSITFAGGGHLQLDVECIDVTLFDSDKIWPTRNRPVHDGRFN